MAAIRSSGQHNLHKHNKYQHADACCGGSCQTEPVSGSVLLVVVFMCQIWIRPGVDEFSECEHWKDERFNDVAKCAVCTLRATPVCLSMVALRQRCKHFYSGTLSFVWKRQNLCLKGRLEILGVVALEPRFLACLGRAKRRIKEIRDDCADIVPLFYPKSEIYREDTHEVEPCCEMQHCCWPQPRLTAEAEKPADWTSPPLLRKGGEDGESRRRKHSCLIPLSHLWLFCPSQSALMSHRRSVRKCCRPSNVLYCMKSPPPHPSPPPPPPPWVSSKDDRRKNNNIKEEFGPCGSAGPPAHHPPVMCAERQRPRFKKRLIPFSERPFSWDILRSRRKEETC